MTGTLFPLAETDIAATSDDCYTPRWVFDAMGLQFALDVAAPVGGPWHVPAARWFTAADDGLTQPWDGLVWCNPPYSTIQDWVTRWAEHDRAVLMGICAIFVAFRGVGVEPAQRLAAADRFGAVLYGGRS